MDLKRTNADNLNFQELVSELDRDLAIRDGEDHSFYAQYNKINTIRHVVVAYENGNPVGCGAMKEYEGGVMEIKRMFVPIDYRGKGIASMILQELERWAAELNYKKCILETGKRQPEAINLYKKNNYSIIDNYGQYASVENSVCFAKYLTRETRAS